MDSTDHHSIPVEEGKKTVYGIMPIFRTTKSTEALHETFPGSTIFLQLISVQNVVQQFLKKGGSQ
jgi:hypothetical protein